MEQKEKSIVSMAFVKYVIHLYQSFLFVFIIKGCRMQARSENRVEPDQSKSSHSFVCIFLLLIPSYNVQSV